MTVTSVVVAMLAAIPLAAAMTYAILTEVRRHQTRERRDWDTGGGDYDDGGDGGGCGGGGD